MTIGHFIWTDLSTYDMATGRADYEKFFGWSFQNNDNYDFASAHGREVCGLFPMPARLAEIKMPSFWMSYVHVADVEASVAKARTHENVIIEVEPQAFNETARVALVRDPSGAGFTLYEGPEIEPAHPGQGTVTTRFRHLPDLTLIQDFYGDLFGWTFEKASDEPWPKFDIRHADGAIIGHVEEVPETIRGKFRYWMPCFEVKSTRKIADLVKSNGGQHVFDLPDDRAMLADQQGAHFLVRSATSPLSKQSRNTVSKIDTARAFAWKSAFGLACVWCAVFFDIQAFWGVLFLIWTWPALKSGRADFVEPIDRATRPIMYWSIVGTWLALSAWLIAVSLLDLIAN